MSTVYSSLRHNLTLITECLHTGLVPDSPTFFNSSPFKVLSPQSAKFLKSLLPVKEENKVKKVLEARPLLGQEVRWTEQCSHSQYRGNCLSTLSVSSLLPDLILHFPSIIHEVLSHSVFVTI